MLANLPVILVAGDREVTRSISNTFGEFQLEYVPESDLRLLVPLSPGTGTGSAVGQNRHSCKNLLQFIWDKDNEENQSTHLNGALAWPAAHGADHLHPHRVPQQRAERS